MRKIVHRVWKAFVLAIAVLLVFIFLTPSGSVRFSIILNTLLPCPYFSTAITALLRKNQLKNTDYFMQNIIISRRRFI